MFEPGHGRNIFEFKIRCSGFLFLKLTATDTTLPTNCIVFSSACLSNVSEHGNVHYFQLVFTVNAEASDRCGIRTRATEVTGALNQRLRPLGQPAMIQREIPERVVAIAKDNAKTG